MAERIYIRNGKALEPMDEQRFALEDELQELLAERPDLIDGEQMSPSNPRRWLLVKREMGVPAAVDGNAWWWLDHLLVDQDAVPTLVEVKRGKNAQIHYEIVGQMMNYAAHGSAFWTESVLRRSFSETWGDGANDQLADFLRPTDGQPEASPFWNHEEDHPDDDAFWSQVATNLAARRLRLLFVADHIPDDLALIVEFLNAHMRDNIEALAVEVKQFKDEAEERSALVPRVIGRTAAALGGTGGPRIRSKISLDDFMSRLPSDAVRDATQRLFDIAQDCGAKIELGDKGVTIRVKAPGYHYLVTVAWLYPPGGPFWMGLKNYAFGECVSKDVKLPEKRKEALRAWVGQFEGDGDAFGERHHRYDTVRARIVTHQEAATQIDTLTERLRQVILDLQAS